MAAADSRALPMECPPLGGPEGCRGVRGSGWPPASSGGRDEGADGDRTGPVGSRHAVSEGIGKPERALGRADTVRGRPPDPDGQQRLGTTGARSGGGAEELLWLGFALERSVSGGVVLDLCHVVALEAQCS